MSLKLGDLAPTFTAETTHGAIDFHQWLGDRWGVLFSHPKDFTPVCTTELGLLATLAPEFERRGVRVMGLSVDSLDAHREWSKDILRGDRRRPELSDDRRPRPAHRDALRHARYRRPATRRPCGRCSSSGPTSASSSR